MNIKLYVTCAQSHVTIRPIFFISKTLGDKRYQCLKTLTASELEAEPCERIHDTTISPYNSKNLLAKTPAYKTYEQHNHIFLSPPISSPTITQLITIKEHNIYH